VPKNNQLATIKQSKVNKKITKNDIVKPSVYIIITFSDNNNFESSKAVCLLNTELENLKSLLRNPSTNKRLFAVFYRR
jgi:hypothetical protein